MGLIRTLSSNIDLSDGFSTRLLKVHTLLLFTFLYVPIGVVVLLSFTPDQVPTFPMPGISLQWYAEILPPNYNEELISALFTSLKIATLSSIGAGVIGTLAAFGMVRHDLHIRWLSTDKLNTAFLLPLVVPWIVTGIAVATLYSLLGIYGTFWSVVLGHILITIPFVVTIVSSQLYGFDRSLEEAAQNLGASEIRTFYEVTFPIVVPGILGGMLFAFTISFDNFTQTFFWTSFGTDTLPVFIYSMIRTGIDPSVNAIGTVIVGFSLTVAVIGEKLSQRVLD
ncbi:ABC transporter permease [Halopenitus persicus]|uniref:Spermidine/putrescine transport system permease protein n=1 Tax=Halopenitus persicus TaxID=1048396 RepID=A0A1H3E6G9_9EURY|nr:ABC transporter permease [Halopenitus persicus]SDX74342.1 spermidine/putrescine transport system permease protein [Halopenitus persicus]